MRSHHLEESYNSTIIDIEKQQRLVRDLSLALIYLTSWEEKEPPGETARRAWKGYDFEVLAKLKEEQQIDFSLKAKSLYLTAEGEKEAQRLVEKMSSSY